MVLMSNFKFSFEEKGIVLKVRECRTIFQKMSGLMFRRNSPPLLFYFKGETDEPIHSFFCVDFIAIWFNKNKIVDVKYVKPWNISVKSKEKFDKLLEIPSNSKWFNLFYRGKERFKY